MKALSAAVAAISVAGGLAQGQIFAGLIHPSPSTYQEPILVSRAYTGMEAKQRMFQWYELVKGQGYQWRSAPGQTNIIFVRGCDVFVRTEFCYISLHYFMLCFLRQSSCLVCCLILCSCRGC